MANGIYAAAAGLAAQQDRIDAISNDLANVGTTGYRSERVGFQDLLYGPEDNVSVGGGATAVDAGRSNVQGALAASSNPIALAINGSGYFQVKRADGTNALTRDGDFQIDAAGSLVSSNGEQLVPPIKLPAGTAPSDVTIASDGTVSVSTGAASAPTTVGKIALVDVPAQAGLLAVGSNDFQTTAASGATAPATGAKLVQGQLEQSNVDVASAMSSLLDAQQSYSLMSHAIQTQDQLLQIANELRQ
jgi:flagellar basal-body rod protein FlgG